VSLSGRKEVERSKWKERSDKDRSGKKGMTRHQQDKEQDKDKTPASQKRTTGQDVNKTQDVKAGGACEFIWKERSGKIKVERKKVTKIEGK
jgi:hypothetical protein